MHQELVVAVSGDICDREPWVTVGRDPRFNRWCSTRSRSGVRSGRKGFLQRRQARFHLGQSLFKGGRPYWARGRRSATNQPRQHQEETRNHEKLHRTLPQGAFQLLVICAATCFSHFACLRHTLFASTRHFPASAQPSYFAAASPGRPAASRRSRIESAISASAARLTDSSFTSRLRVIAATTWPVSVSRTLMCS